RREVSCEIPPFNNCHHAVPLRYAVLASLSGRYSPPKGRLPTCYSPVRHSPGAEAPFPFDLQLLGTPPALILSQDQTLSHKSWSLSNWFAFASQFERPFQLSAPSALILRLSADDHSCGPLTLRSLDKDTLYLVFKHRLSGVMTAQRP